MNNGGLGFEQHGHAGNGSAHGAVGVEGMFQQIMEAVAKSGAEISELRQECADLRQSNANLERQLRDAFQRTSSLAYSQTAPSSPNLRPQTVRSPFLGPAGGPTSIYVPPAGDAAEARSREVPGFWAVVPAGGAGTRLWPLSRQSAPKFLLDLTLQGRSLIQSTWDRLLPLTTPDRLMVVTGRVHSGAVHDQLPDLLGSNIFSEPSPKESMAAIGLAAAVLAKRDPEAVLGSFAADHIINGTDAFMTAVTEAAAVARAGYLVTIGIAPAQPATGFGYIRLGESLDLKDAPNARRVSQFKEKPDARTAAAYLSTGQYLWNGGMFVVKAAVLMQLLNEYMPELHDGLQTIADAWDGDETTREKVIDAVWPTLPKIAIDHAVAEPASQTGKVAVVPATFGWDDVGDFSSLADLIPAEASQPRILGESSLVVTDQMAGGIVVPASGRLVACLGVDDLVIVDTSDALLVTTRARSQEVKRLVSKCREAGFKTLL
ncbi:mannose-1-phosphate guanylyltransferase [Auricularia subglabra TFB-10046 SS5]|nr:mannose-1-phosphate guanylyltransferase [Auricularia subglabra TFB-10046 SS5]